MIKEDETFHGKLKSLMHSYVKFIYKLTKEFPRDEIYGVISQLRRATLSIILNYIEGFARRRSAVKLNFFEISYGSLKESKHLLFFSNEEGYVKNDDYQSAMKLAEEIGAMLWKTIVNLEEEIK